MDRNDNFDNKKSSSDLDEYVAREIMQYYGEDVINNINRLDTPSPKKKRISRYRSAIGVICSVMFLVGAMIFSGVVIASEMPFAEKISSDYPAETETSVSSSTDGITSVQSHSKTSDSTETSTASSHTESETSSAESSTDGTTSVKSHSESSDSTETSTASSHTESQTSSAESSTDGTAKEQSVPENTDTETDSRHGYSLPEIPEEGTVTEIQTDTNNNESTNPYDNVTTGKRIKAGIGIFLMVMSLTISFVLKKIGCDYENMN